MPAFIKLLGFLMTAFVLKQVGKRLDYVLDWRSGYLEPLETIIDDLGWEIPNSPDGKRDLRITEQHHDFYRSWAEFSGGIPGKFYLVSNKVRTSRGRVLSQSIVVRIAIVTASKSGE